jgi:hypothetical protein
MTPEAAVARLFDIIAGRTEFTEDTVYAAMGESGVPGPVADRAYKFAQIACGRQLLSGMDISFSSDYTCFNAAGDAIESGRLAEQPYFAAATAAVGRYVGTPGFKRLALMAAEVHAVNELLNKGSRPEDLATSAPVLFMEPPTLAGMERVRQQLSQGVGRSKKPWWRFW